MQSVKNTSVAIMLLFLSYGVYHVLMKPLPEEDYDESIESLAIMDPGEEGGLTESSSLALDPFPSEPKSQDSIPPELLQLSESQTQGVESSSVDMSNDSLPEIGSDVNDRDFSPALSSNEKVDSGFSSQLNSTEDTEDISDSAIGFQEGGHLDSDLEVVANSGMVDVAPQNIDRDTGDELTDDQPIDPRPATLAESWPKINAFVEGGEYQQALRLLTGFYRWEDIADNERQKLLDWLDALAAKVIYSSEHHLRSLPYIIQPGDTIASLARQWKVPAQLIYNINSSKIPDPHELTPGVEIKLIEGPFDAEIDSTAETLTLFLDEMYAGRFNLKSSPGIGAGEFVIVDKSAQDRIDRPFCIKLNNDVSIYAAENQPVESDQICLQPEEAEEIFSILSASSKIRVLR